MDQLGPCGHGGDEEFWRWRWEEGGSNVEERWESNYASERKFTGGAALKFQGIHFKRERMKNMPKSWKELTEDPPDDSMEKDDSGRDP